jgi:co-chaperonin GroES (HSP10)
MKRIIPQKGKVILRDGSQDQLLDGGLVCTVSSQQSQAMVTGVVDCMKTDKPYIFNTAFGEERELRDGTKVLFDKSRGTNLYWYGEAYIMIDILHITAILEEDD